MYGPKSLNVLGGSNRPSIHRWILIRFRVRSKKYKSSTAMPKILERVIVPSYLFYLTLPTFVMFELVEYLTHPAPAANAIQNTHTSFCFVWRVVQHNRPGWERENYCLKATSLKRRRRNPNTVAAVLKPSLCFLQLTVIPKSSNPRHPIPRRVHPHPWCLPT